MKRLSKKLHSQSGASILMGLLMFLVCCMVAGSILAAASANAGKIHSNRAEQQKYLVLSSAIRLVADEIQKAEYTGKYKVHEWTVTTVEKKDGVVVSSSSQSFFHCQQVAGDYACGDLTEQLPLKKELDEIFSRQFTGSGYTALSGDDVELGTGRTLTVKLTGLTPDAGPAAYRVIGDSTDVTVQVDLNHDTHHIILTAWLGTDAVPPGDLSDTMVAELVVKAGTEPVLDYNPAGRTPSALSIPASNPSGNPSVTVSKSESDEVAVGAPMKWELNWIRKGTAT